MFYSLRKITLSQKFQSLKKYRGINNLISPIQRSRDLYTFTHSKIHNNKTIRSAYSRSYSDIKDKETIIKNTSITKIFSISDLHLEYYEKPQTLYQNIKNLLPQADILVLAGDIGYPMDSHGDKYMFLLDRFKQQFKQVILVPGNHEYFQTKNFDRDEIIDKLNTICKKTSCHLLNNDTIDLNGIRFVGTTLWTDIDPRLKCLANTKGKTFGSIFKDFESYQNEYRTCLKFLQKELAKQHEKKVIITHHVPSYSLQHSKYKNKKMYDMSGIDSMFYSEILDLLNLADVKYWFCGHTHESGSMMYRNTQIIINPVGAPWEKSKRLTDISNNVLLI